MLITPRGLQDLRVNMAYTVTITYLVLLWSVKLFLDQLNDISSNQSPMTWSNTELQEHN